MRLKSVTPWLNPSRTLPRCVLLYGSNPEILGFRGQLLQQFYRTLGYNFSHADSWDTAVSFFEDVGDLFESELKPRFIYLNSITDSMVKEEDLKRLATTPHFLLLESGKFTSKARTLGLFQQAPDRAVIPCYEVDHSEIKEAFQGMESRFGFKCEPAAAQKLCHYLSFHLSEFFSLCEMIALYTGQDMLTESDLEKALSDLDFSSPKSIAEPFLLGDAQGLIHYLGQSDPLEWVGFIRILIQDVVHLMALSIYKISSAALKDVWMRGPVKFPYPRVTLYQSVLNSSWSLERGSAMLAGLLVLEAELKMGIIGSSTLFQQKLLQLGCPLESTENVV